MPINSRIVESRKPIFWRMSAGTPECVMLAGRLAKFGFSAKACQRIWQDMLDRPSGPMSFRLILQPAMAAIAALHDGIKDARLARSPYLWTLIVGRTERGNRLRQGLISTARIILFAMGMDAIFQLTVSRGSIPVKI